jgi:hypothetical protein
VTRTMAFPKRAMTTATLIVGGGALTVAVWVGGEHGFAVALGAFYVIAGIAAYLLSGGSGDVAAIMRTDGDERQRNMDHEATRLAGLAMGAAAIGGTVVQLARGEDPDGFLWICTVGGAAYVIALAILRHRG